MSAEQWEALESRLAGEAQARGECTAGENLCAYCRSLAGLALFARLMAVTIRSAEHGYDSIKIADNRYPPFEDINKLPAGRLQDALRRYHAGSDNGELMALLCEEWGERPAPRTGIVRRDDPWG